jgi:hypothetical protein
VEANLSLLQGVVLQHDNARFHHTLEKLQDHASPCVICTCSYLPKNDLNGQKFDQLKEKVQEVASTSTERILCHRIQEASPSKELRKMY